MATRKPKQARRSFKYKKRSLDAVNERADQTGNRFDSPFKQGFDIFKPRVGDNTIRFLPSTYGGEHFGLDIYLHRRVGADNSSYLCLKKMKDEPCPICKAYQEAKENGEDEDAKQLYPAHLVLSWIIDRNDDNGHPLLYMPSWIIDRDIAALCRQKNGGVLYIDDPEDGFDVSFRRTGEGLRTRYGAWSIDREASPIAEDDSEYNEIIDFIEANPLTDVLNYYEPKHLEAIMSGTKEERDSDLDDKKDDDDDDDDEVETDEDETDEDETSEDEDNDEDEDEEDEEDEESDEEDEEDEEEKPKPKRRPRGRVGRRR